MLKRMAKVSSLLLVLGLFACDCEKDPGNGDGGPDGSTNDGGPDAEGGVVNVNCGDAVLDVGEDCDDDNATSGDGCSSNCLFEPGYTCPVVGQACIGCGDEIIQAGEFCDDGNQTPNDGCSATCQREPGWDCIEDAEACTPSACGDGFKVGPEDCDDGNRISGDGCSIRCEVEANYVCVTPNFPCRLAVCGDGAVEAQEQCDDGDMDNTPPGCNGMCRLVTGYHCPTPGVACVPATCGDGVVQGLEQCDDGDMPPAGADGCNTTCQLEPNFHCPTPGQACVASTCGNGVREGLEGCDDDDTDAGDGCSATCTVEPFFECTRNGLSVCTKPIEFVRIARFNAPMDQPQALHYDPRTRSFVAYDFDATDTNAAQEFCLDGTPGPVSRDAHLEARRDAVSVGSTSGLDGAAYDPFRDRFLFVRQDGKVFEFDRQNNPTPGIADFQLNGLGTAGGIQVGDDGRIYATNHHHPDDGGPTGPGLIRVFRRTVTGTLEANSEQSFSPVSRGTYLDNIFNIPGLGWIGYYNLPNPALTDPNEQAFTFHDYTGAVIGTSRIPGVLFRNGETFPDNADGGEAAVDGGYFLVCSEYLDEGSDGTGICQLFAQTCVSSLDCAERVPGTICKLDEPIPYCYSPAVARDDRFTVSRDSASQPLDVLANDAFADAVCSGAAPMITAVTPGSNGGTIAVNGGGTAVNYMPVGGMCGFVETFTYTANLGGGIVDTASVRVTVPCVCGNNIIEQGEECDGGNNTPGDGCSATCQIESACGNGIVEEGEQCDDDNTMPGDGCSPTCTAEIE